MNQNRITYALMGTILLVLLASIERLLINPVVPEKTMLLSMIVPVICGILLGKYTGAIVGGVGMVIANLLPTRTEFTLLLIVPYIIMGYAAGKFTDRYGPTVGSLGLLFGYLTIILIVLFSGRLSLAELGIAGLYIDTGFEMLINLAAINMLTLVYKEFMLVNNTHFRRW